jgi:hypothetical protein
MRRIIKNIPVFFLLLAAFALNAHMIIPHDHHSAEPVSGIDSECPVSGGGSGHHTGFPVHCHAFNDLTSEKARPNHVTQKIKYSSVALVIFSVISAEEFFSASGTLAEACELSHDSFLLEYSSLRAPPSLI